MLASSGQPSPPCTKVSSARSTVKVTALMTRNPARRGEMSLARPNGSRPTIAVITAVNRAPRAALLRAPCRSSTATVGSFPGPGDRRLACRWPAGHAVEDPGNRRLAAE